VVDVSCRGVVEVSDGVEVVVGVTSGGRDDCEEVLSCDVDVVVGVDGSGADDSICDEGEFWRGTNRAP